MKSVTGNFIHKNQLKKVLYKSHSNLKVEWGTGIYFSDTYHFFKMTLLYENNSNEMTCLV